jgi:lipopolysaccharide transport system ATP-binding protein
MIERRAMSDVAIRIEHLSKHYKLGAARTRHDTLRDQVADGVKRLFRPHGRPRHDAETIRALDDLSLEINGGEVVGIIGRNGAGKSTLLKILARITEPTSGVVRIRGRVGSLLEVGTGFHPELTGRENIYLSGAVLGMKKAEIDARFDEIVAFAETEKFLDTPLKRYSSGMYVRLAFAVAAHLDPAILIVDEVLAVGDARFQRKCLNKLEVIGRERRTVLFVSHNMQAITRLCDRVVLLDEGRVLRDGASHQVVGAYLSAGLGIAGAREWPDATTSPGGEIARLRAVRVRSPDGLVVDATDIGQPVRIEMEYEVLKPGYRLLPNFQLFNGEGVHIFSTHDTDPARRRSPRECGKYISAVWVPGNLLSDGPIFVGAGLETIDPAVVQFYEPDAVRFQVIEGPHPEGDSARAGYGGRIGGVVRPLLQWTSERTEDS